MCFLNLAHQLIELENNFVEFLTNKNIYIWTLERGSFVTIYKFIVLYFGVNLLHPSEDFKEKYHTFKQKLQVEHLSLRVQTSDCTNSTFFKLEYSPVT